MFEAYRNRLNYSGEEQQDSLRTQDSMIKEVGFRNSLSYKKVFINGKPYDARITTDVPDTAKTGNGNYQIEFRHGVYFLPGTYVEIKNVFGTIET